MLFWDFSISQTLHSPQANINNCNECTAVNHNGKHILAGEEERVEHLHSHHMQLAQPFFPSCICGAALPVINLLEDLEVNPDGVSGEVKEKTKQNLWELVTMQNLKTAMKTRWFLVYERNLTLCDVSMFVVSEVADKVIWSCLVEEPTLFLRTFLEKLTHKDKQVTKAWGFQYTMQCLYNVPHYKSYTNNLSPEICPQENAM